MFAKDDAASEQLGLFGYWDLGKESNNWALVDGYDNSWEVIASGDFNGDGTTDMLWKNDFIGDESMHFNGYCTWSMNPVDNPVWQMVSIANPFEWNFLTVGDFNGDGTDDIAMINGEGMVGIWTMNKGTVAIADGDTASWTILNKVDDPEAWTLAEVGDFNGDGTDDIAWCNVETGLCGYWQIENNQTKSWNVIANLA